MVTALLGVLILVVVASYVFVEFFVNPMKLRTDSHFQGQSSVPIPCPLPSPFSSLLTTHLCLIDLKNDTDRWFIFLPVAPVETRAPTILVLAMLLILLGLLSIGLLGHLLCFHVYLSESPSSAFPVGLKVPEALSCPTG